MFYDSKLIKVNYQETIQKSQKSKPKQTNKTATINHEKYNRDIKMREKKYI